MEALTGRTVVVTGAAGGIGRALALGFHADGAAVVAADVDERGLATLPAALARVGADVADPAGATRAIEAALAATGRVDVLVNNAGVAVDRPFEDYGPGEFERIVQVNLFGAVHATRAALPAMRRQAYGRIVNLLSRAGEIARTGLAAYAASKAGLWALTRSLARELRGTGILVNGLVPGPTRSGMVQHGRPPATVYPTARMLATLPANGPTGKAFRNGREDPLLAR